MKISIKSEFNCLLMVDDNKFLLEDGVERVEIEVDKNAHIILLVYPTKHKNLLPYAVDIECDKSSVVTASQNVELIQVGDEEFELVLRKNKVNKIGGGQTYSFEEDNVLLVIVEGQPNLFFARTPQGGGFFEFECEIKQVAFEIKNQVPYFIASTAEGKYLCVYCPIKQTFYDFKAVKVEINENVIIVVENLGGHAKHGRLTQLELTEEVGVEIKSQDLLYAKGEPVRATNAKALPFAFFQSIKVGDFNLAKTYLSKSLQEIVSNEMLVEYFGDFDKVIPYNFHQDHGTYLCVVSKKVVKVFSFKIESAKIIEIDLIKEYIKN